MGSKRAKLEAVNGVLFGFSCRGTRIACGRAGGKKLAAQDVPRQSLDFYSRQNSLLEWNDVRENISGRGTLGIQRPLECIVELSTAVRLHSSLLVRRCCNALAFLVEKTLGPPMGVTTMSSRLVSQSTVQLALKVPKFTSWDKTWSAHHRAFVGYPAANNVSRYTSSMLSSRKHCPPLSVAPADLSSSSVVPEVLEEKIERVIYGCRFMTLLGVSGSLVGSLLCFIKGCTYVAQSFAEYLVNRSKVILLLVEAIDVYLLGTVMLVFGMGLYELFVCNLDIAKTLSEGKNQQTSNLFGLFTLKERPKWLEIKSVNELKTKLGHVIVMLLLIGLFDKSKKAAIHSPVDLLCFSASVLLSSGCLYLLSKLADSE